MKTYKIMGYKTEPIETNSLVPTHPKEIVIYETDDEQEARKIVRNGGYIDSNDVYFPVTRVVATEGVNTDDSSGFDSEASPSSTLKKGDV